MVSSWSGGFHPESCNWRTSNGHWMLVQYFTGNSSNSKHLGEEALEVCGQFPVAMVSAFSTCSCAMVLELHFWPVVLSWVPVTTGRPIKQTVPRWVLHQAFVRYPSILHAAEVLQVCWNDRCNTTKIFTQATHLSGILHLCKPRTSFSAFLYCSDSGKKTFKSVLVLPR